MCVHACVFIMNEYAHSSQQSKVWFRYGTVCYVCHVVHTCCLRAPRTRLGTVSARQLTFFDPVWWQVVWVGRSKREMRILLLYSLNSGYSGRQSSCKDRGKQQRVIASLPNGTELRVFFFKSVCICSGLKNNVKILGFGFFVASQPAGGYPVKPSC